MTSDAVDLTTLARTLRTHASARPAAPAVTSAAARRTYAELADDVARTAASLRRAGLRPGDRFVVAARNSADYVRLLYAASWSGAVLVCLNWRLAPQEAAAVLADSEPRLVFAEREWATLVDDGREVIWLDEGRLAQWSDADPVPIHPDHGEASIVLQMYTTGTTGAAKGVQLSERNVRHMCDQACRAWLMHPRMSFLAVLPFFHVSGLSSVITCVHSGGQVVVPAGASVQDIGTAVQEHRVTHTVLVPTVLSSLVRDDAASSYDLSSLEVLIYGSAPSGSSLVEQAMAMLPSTGFSQGYGLTETSAGVAIAPVLRHGDVDPAPGSVGRINPNCEARIVDPATGEDLPPGLDGELWLRTEQLTPGYWRKPELTSAAIDQDGWFRTGDIGSFDEAGHLWIRDRLKDMIISGGENIYSVEVENEVAGHPDVVECAVVGVPHETWGETVKAVVVRERGSSLTEESLMEHLQDRLARYKQPRVVEFVDELPRTGSGKILKRRLRREVVSHG